MVMQLHVPSMVKALFFLNHLQSYQTWHQCPHACVQPLKIQDDSKTNKRISVKKFLRFFSPQYVYSSHLLFLES